LIFKLKPVYCFTISEPFDQTETDIEATF
jgi:hypothetical protein